MIDKKKQLLYNKNMFLITFHLISILLSSQLSALSPLSHLESRIQPFINSKVLCKNSSNDRNIQEVKNLSRSLKEEEKKEGWRDKSLLITGTYYCILSIVALCVFLILYLCVYPITPSSVSKILKIIGAVLFFISKAIGVILIIYSWSRKILRWVLKKNHLKPGKKIVITHLIALSVTVIGGILIGAFSREVGFVIAVVVLSLLASSIYGVFAFIHLGRRKRLQYLRKKKEKKSRLEIQLNLETVDLEEKEVQCVKLEQTTDKVELEIHAMQDVSKKLCQLNHILYSDTQYLKFA